MRTTSGLGASWRYLPRFEDSFVDPSLDLSAWEPVELPHANRELPYNAFDEKDCQFVSAYARDVELPALEGGRRAFLDFEGVMVACEVHVGGRPAGSHEGGYTPFSVEVTSLVRPGANRVVLRVDSTERPDIPPFGHVVDYLCYGGVYRGVSLRVTEASFIARVFARPEPAGPGRPARLVAEVQVDGKVAGLSAHAVLRERPAGGAATGAERPGRILGEGRAGLGDDGLAVVTLGDLEGVRNWDLDDPALYDLEVFLEERAGAASGPLDSWRERVGFRRAEWRPEGFFLNGRKVAIMGLNRHQAWPYSGYAMPARAQRRDAEILKRELGVNLVRASHYPQARAYLDACDELGLLVFEELPGWQHVGDAAWKDRACASLEEMILRDRNRPSIVLWGVRINESQDDHDFYARTNAIAHRLDPTRQTGGVRYVQRSELLEDVYTFNDFVHHGGNEPLRKPRKVTGLRRDVPYLVTEHNGHMCPTKRFDNEERLQEHALRHARVLDAARGNPHVAGAIGWCAFDYNTHKDFGSGDRICYHGVSDMFRLPKYAAALYASQRDAADGVVLEAASVFAKGERSAARFVPIEVYTNCDEVELWRGGRRVGAFRPDRRAFPHLAHPPVVIRDLVGDQLAEKGFSRHDQAVMRAVVSKILAKGLESLHPLDMARLGLLLLRNRMAFAEGEALVSSYILGWGQKDETWELVGRLAGKEVARRTYGADAVATRLVARADDGRLAARGVAAIASGEPSGEAWDCTRVVVRLEDQYGNLSPFAAECVDLEVEGPGRLIGPSRVPLMGGCVAAWVRTTGEPGRIVVRVRGTRFEAEALAIEAD